MPPANDDSPDPKPRGGMFRRQALEQLSSPEQLDELLRVTTRRSWIPLGTLAGAMLLALVWSLLGQIPITVEGSGVLVYPRRVVSFQAPAAGQIAAIEVAEGDLVERGQRLLRLGQPALAQLLEQERLRLAELARRSTESESLREQRLELERAGLARKRAVLEAQVESLRRYAEAQRGRNRSYLDEQQASLARVRRITREVGRSLEERYASFQRLLDEGLSSQEAVLQARERLVESQMQIADMELRAQEIEMNRLRADSEYREHMNRIADLELQIQDIAVREAELEQGRVEDEADRQRQLQEIQLNIERYEEELRTKGEILSDYTGRVLELTVAAGQIVAAGERLGAMEADDTEARLMAAAYFSVGEGKKLEPGDEVRISPATVEAARFGSLVGRVRSVSPFPVTSEAIGNVVGNRELARELAAGSSRIQVLIDLEVDAEADSGYRWTSRSGPDVQVTAGTTARARATVEKRRPISFVIPLLRSWSGI